MNWFFIALIAYFLLAIANLIDKFLVEKVMGSARAYTFISCLMSSVVLVASPWFLSWPGLNGLFLDLFLGGVFAVALLLLYASLRRGEASRALVIIGGSTPVFSLPLSLLILGDRFSTNQLLAIIFLIIGLLIVVFLPGKNSSFWDKWFASLSLKDGYSRDSILLALGSGLAYALFFVGSKLAYEHQAFVSTFLWTRLGAVLAAMLLLFSARARREIKNLFVKNPSRGRNQGLVVGNQILGSAGFVLQNYAIYLGPVAIINALQGMQYAWIIIIGAVLSVLRPGLLRENVSRRSLIQKGAAIFIISIGLYFLSL